MNKKSKSKKRSLCFDDMPIVATRKKLKKKKFDPAKKLRDSNFVAKVFFQALAENDIDAALEVLNGYLMAIGKSEIARQGSIASSTVYHALSYGSNPTLKTVAKLLSAA